MLVRDGPGRALRIVKFITAPERTQALLRRAAGDVPLMHDDDLLPVRPAAPRRGATRVTSELTSDDGALAALALLPSLPGQLWVRLHTGPSTGHALTRLRRSSGDAML